MIASLAIAASAAEPVKVDGFSHVRSLGGVEEFRLNANGLRVLVLEQRGAPVVTFMVTYHVGSRNEVTGTTGATHLLEHLMFKGTAKYNRSLGTGFDQMLERVGAETNATTWHDRTNYFATVPVNALALLVELEADRMKNLTLAEEDRRPEMTVVRNEFERGENDPRSALDKEIWASAFMAHPYHHDTIGWRSDIERVPIAKLREFYETYYWPDNATATVIGGVGIRESLETVRTHFGAIPKSPRPFPEMYTQEPEQTAQRRVQVRRTGELGVVSLAHKIPHARHADWPAVEVLSAVLTVGKTSRFYRALTDKNLTTDVSAFNGFNLDPSLHTIYAELADDAKHADVEAKLVAELERVKKDGVTADEVRTAVEQLLASRAFARDGSFAQAEVINECIAAGDWTLFVTLDEKFRAVTAADVQRVAKKYFVEKRSVAGWFVPHDGSENDEPTEAAPAVKDDKFEQKAVVPPRPPEKELAAPPKTDFAKRVVRETVAGLDVQVCRAAVEKVVTIRGSLPAGEAASQNRALAHLAAGMLERGTTKRGKFAIAEALEKSGVELDFRAGNETVEFSGKCPAAALPTLMEALAEQLRTPAFAADEFKKLQKQLSSETQMTLEDTNTQGLVAFTQAAFPEGHPNRRWSVPDLIVGFETAKLAAVKEFHRTAYGPVGMRLVVVGDVDAPAVKSLVERHFTGWAGGASTPAAKEPGAPKPVEKTVAMLDKSSVSVFIGQPSTLRAADADWLPVSLATGVLGRGFTSRLVGTVRDREGLTYGIGSNLTADSFNDGAWLVRATFSPTLLDKGIASTRREIAAWHAEGITAGELAYRKSAAAGQFAVELETTDGLAEQLLRCAERGFPISWMDDFPEKIRDLSLDEVNAAVKRRLDPAKMITVRAGTVK